MRIDEYARYDALGLAELVRKKEVSAAQLLETAISAIEQVDGTLNAMVGKRYDKARAELANASPKAPFYGVPFALKDMAELEGERVTYGAVLARDYVAERTHERVRRYQQAGLMLLGRTNMSELGLLPNCEPPLYGPTKNPWDLDRSPGGSSGGTAALVAAGALPAAQGGDGGGSIRIPASACGLVGLKPCRGRHPSDYTDAPDGFISYHALTRTVRDSAALLDLLAAPHTPKRFWAPPPEEPYLQAIEKPVGKLRIGFTTESLTGHQAHPDCCAAVQHAAQLLTELGHEVEEAKPELDGDAFFEGFAVLWAMAAGYFPLALREALAHGGAPDLVARALRLKPVFTAAAWAYGAAAGHAPMERFTRRLMRINTASTPADMWLAWTKMQRAGDALSQFLTRYDLHLTPVLGEPPWPTGHLDQSAPDEEVFEKLRRYTGFTPICNTAGLPAISLPLYWNDAGVPIGVHCIAPFAREDRLLQLARQLEEAQPWRDKRPPFFVR